MKKIFVWLLIAIFIITGCGKQPEVEVKDEQKQEKEISIVDMNSKSRPYAVVINNYPGAIKVQSGLQDAYMIYEFPVEGGLSRSMALYKDKKTDKIGTVRSARHDFLDYALENDAIFVHFGWSYYAQVEIPQLGVNNINGLYDSGFWRENPERLASEHTAYTSIENATSVATNRGYRLTTDTKPVLKYTTEQINLNEKESAMPATSVEIPYSGAYTVKFVYNEANQNYDRYVNGNAHTDYFTKEQYTSKNIIVVKLDYELTASNYYLELKNIGTGEGYYITNGTAVPIKWEKKDRNTKTIYKYLDGEELEVNDGNTYVMFQTTNKNIKMS